MANMIDWPRDRGLLEQLELHEGKRLMPYRDSVGLLTIGTGRCLDRIGISDDESSYLLGNDVRRAAGYLDEDLAWWRTLDPVRQRVLIDMGFNLGGTGLAGFKATLRAIKTGDYETGEEQMGKSKWAEQVGYRAVRLRAMMKTGMLPKELR